MSRLKPDVCVIGAGAGGAALAAQLAGAGRRVVVVEPGDGGGTVPLAIGMNALVAAAADLRRGRGSGETPPPASDIDFRSVARHVRAVQARAAPNRATDRLAALGAVVLRERARFHDPRTVIAGEHEIEARDIVVATGSAPVPPAIDGLDAVDHLTEETALALSRRPAKLVIAGGGPHALPFAQAFSRLGSEVTVVGGGLLDGVEPDQAAMLLRLLRRDGIAIEDRLAVTRVEPRGKTGALVHVTTDERDMRVIEASRLLVMRERVPAIDGLDPVKGRVWLGPKGILVDPWLRTRNRRVHAIGDVTGGPFAVHHAEHHAAIVAATILRGRRDGRGAGPTPRVVFTDPQIAAVGLDEAQARGRRDARTVRLPLSENEHALASRAGPGFIKIVTDRRQAILGVSILAGNAAEMIAPWSLAVQHGMTLADMAAAVPAFPTAGEIGKRAAIFYLADAARAPGRFAGLRLPRLRG